MTPLWRRILRIHGPDPRSDVRDEFTFHLDERTDALIASGKTPAEARAEALAQFGDISAAAAACADMGARRAQRIRTRERLDSVVQDVTYAIRAMRRAPGFTAAAVATIALGIGANTAVFSLLNALLLQPLDASNPRELVRVYTSEGRVVRDSSDNFGASSYADYVDLARSRTLTGLAAFIPLGATLQAGGAISRHEGRLVSDNYFTIIGRPLLLGGWSGAGNSGDPEAIVSHRFWTTTLGGDSAAIGRSLLINGRTVRVAGITHDRFRGIEPNTVDLYLPITRAPEFTGHAGFLTERDQRGIRLLGRLAPGATEQTAQRDLNAVMRVIAGRFPESNARRVISVRRATSVLPRELVGDGMLPTVALIFGATLVMLAIAGVNLAAVLLARTIRRRRELAVRLSLGASPLRLVRQLVTESVLLALIAGAIVVALVALLPTLASQLGVPRSVQPEVDLTVLGYAVAVALGSGVVFGLAPALLGIRSSVVDSLRGGESDARPTKARAQRLLVSAQLALSMLLLIVGGALLRSLQRQQQVNPGFVVERLVTAIFEDPTGREDRNRQRAFTALIVQRLGNVPGVRSVSVASMAPLSGDGMRSTIHIPGYAEGPEEDMEIPLVLAGPDFFRTLGVSVRKGRELTWADRDTNPRVVVNEAMARRYWGRRDPIGSFVQLGGKGGTPAEVIAVVENVRFYSLAEPPKPTFTIQRGSGGGSTVLIRTVGDPETLIPTLRGLMSRGDVPMMLVGLRTMAEVLSASLVVSRAVSGTLIAIGMLAVLLAAVGLYGVVSYVMAGRTREFGVRVALGATAGSIARLVVGYGLRLTLIGTVVGALLGGVALLALGGMLFGTVDFAPTIGAVTLVLCLVTLLACAVPAIRARSTSPAEALRAE